MKKCFYLATLCLMVCGTVIAAGITLDWSWDPVTKDQLGAPESIDHYELEVKMPDGTLKYFTSKTVGLSTTFIPAGSYVARIRAYDLALNVSDWSDPATGDVPDTTPPAKPTGLKCNRN